MKAHPKPYLKIISLILVLAVSVLCTQSDHLALKTKPGKNPVIVSDGKISDLLKEAYQLGDPVNTSSLRKEIKYIVTRETAEAVYQELKNYYGDTMSLRDVPAPGMENVTRTLYPAPFAFSITHPETGKKKKIKAKLRIRTYYSRSLGSSDYGERVPFTGEDRFFEIKIDHMIYEDVVIKHRLLLPDDDILTCLDGNKFKIESSKTFAGIRKNIADGSSRNDVKLVDYFEKFLTRVHALEDSPSLLKPFV